MKFFSVAFPALLALALLTRTPAGAEPFKLYLDETYTQFIMAEKQDCAIHKTEDGRITLGFKAGNFLINVGPEITFGKKAGIDWDSTIQGFIARYQELCARFNTGSLTKAEYDKRLERIEALDREAYELYRKYLEEREKQRQNLFDELDREVAARPGMLSAIKKNQSQIDRQLNDIKFKD
ncbi:MAG: hypothetical protein HZA02_07430 [Nitrospinae bacterium]|nr:hypothetical protein [Nitrospinota bacterium]